MITPPFFGSIASTSSGTLRGISQTSREATVRKDHRRLGDADRFAHGVGRGMRQVDQHAEPVHLAHDLLAEGSQPVVLRRILHRGIGPVGVTLCVSVM